MPKSMENNLWSSSLLVTAISIVPKDLLQTSIEINDRQVSLKLSILSPIEKMNLLNLLEKDPSSIG